MRSVTHRLTQSEHLFKGLYSIFAEELVKPLPLDPIVCSPALATEVYEVADEYVLKLLRKEIWRWLLKINV